MPLVGSALGAAIKAKMMAIPGVNVTEEADLDTFCQAIGEAVVEYVTANAVVTTTVVGQTIVTGGSSAGTYPLALGAGTGTIS